MKQTLLCSWFWKVHVKGTRQNATTLHLERFPNRNPNICHQKPKEGTAKFGDGAAHLRSIPVVTLKRTATKTQPKCFPCFSFPALRFSFLPPPPPFFLDFRLNKNISETVPAVDFLKGYIKLPLLEAGSPCPSVGMRQRAPQGSDSYGRRLKHYLCTSDSFPLQISRLPVCNQQAGRKLWENLGELSIALKSKQVAWIDFKTPKSTLWDQES